MVLDRLKAVFGGASPKDVGKTFDDMRAERFARAAYAAGTPSKFRRTRTRLGGTADAHYAVRSEYDLMREVARDYDRNDAIIGQLVDRAVDNIVRRGFTVDPQTGDAALDLELAEAWRDWSEDPRACDITGRHTFGRMQRLALRHTFIDGDCFAILRDDGRMQLLEPDRVTSNTDFGSALVLGVQLDDEGRPVEYHVTKLKQTQRQMSGIRSVPQDFVKVSAFKADGAPHMLHVYNPKRITQTRGVTALAPVFDVASMTNDLNYAKLVQQQISSVVCMFLERQSDFQFGSRTTEDRSDGTTDYIEDLSPGLIVRGRPGEKMSAFAPNVASAEFFKHITLLIRMIGVQLGMPLSLTMLTTSDTTFHGYRGELQQAQMGFEVVQQWMVERLIRPVYEWRARLVLGDRALENSRLLRARIAGPGFPYVDPTKDVASDSAQLANLLNSPRRLLAKRGHDWSQVVDETVADRSLAIRRAIAEAAAIRAETGEPISWRELLHLAPPSGVSVGAQDEPVGGPREVPDA